MSFNYQFKNSYGNGGVKYHYNEEKVKLLGIYIDNTLNFDYHISHSAKRLGKNCML